MLLFTAKIFPVDKFIALKTYAKFPAPRKSPYRHFNITP